MNKRLLILFFLFTFISVGSSYANIKRKTVEIVWQNISKAADFKRIPVNYEADNEPNAFVAYDDEGNYSLYVTTGLMKILQTEDEIAGVLGHELGHIMLEHYNNFALNDTVSTIMKTNLERSSELAQAIGNIDMELRESKFSREQETEADNYGVKISVKAGYDPWGLYNAMKRFASNGFSAENEINGFNSHPATKERLQNLSDEARKIRKNKNNQNKNNQDNNINELANILMGNY